MSKTLPWLPGVIESGGNVVSDPSTIASANFWVRASDLTGSFTDGQSITGWTDRIGAITLAQEGGVAQPIYSTDASSRAIAIFDTRNSETRFGDSNATYPQINLRAFSMCLVCDIQTLGLAQEPLNIGGVDMTLELGAGKLSTGGNAGTQNTTFKVPTSKPICIVVTCGTGNIKVYIDNVANTQSLTANSAGTGAFKGVSIGRSGLSFFSRVYDLSLFGAELGSTDITKLMNYGASKYGTGGFTASPTGRVIFDGDSVTFGNFCTKNKGFPFLLAPATGWYEHCLAIGGQEINTMVSHAYSSPFAASGNWLFVQGGINDLAASRTGTQIEGDFNTYCTNAVTAGFQKSKIAILTCSTANAFSGERDTLNTRLRANYSGYAGWLVDIAGDSNLGVSTPNGGFLNSSYYFDNNHPNDLGHAAIAALIRSTIGGSLPF